MAELPFSDLHRRLSKPDNDVWAVHYDALARAEQGEDIILLSVGDPDFDTPAYISSYVVEQINAGRTHYSPAAGETVLRRAVADLETRSAGRPIGFEQVVVFPGATAALYAVASVILNEGDTIVVPEPMYIGYRGILETVGADVRTVALPAPEFELDVDAVIAAVTAETKAVLVNTPGNPCGNIIPSDTLIELAARCRELDVWLICDEVYSLITFDVPHTSLLNCAEHLDNVVVIDGLSKSHAMSGWRVGWAVSEAEMSRALAQFSGAALFGVSQFVQDGAAYALNHNAQDVAAMRRAYERRRDFVVRRLDEMSALSYFRPAAGMFVMIDGRRVAQDGQAFSRLLLEDAGVSTIPGEGFGPSAAGYVRLSLTQDVPELGRAMDRIERCVNQLA